MNQNYLVVGSNRKSKVNDLLLSFRYDVLSTIIIVELIQLIHYK